jgi:hypothetical protein
LLYFVLEGEVRKGDAQVRTCVLLRMLHRSLRRKELEAAGQPDLEMRISFSLLRED